MAFELPVLGAGSRSFAFACNRCGHCCSHRSGHVWIGEEELPRLARALGMGEEAFARRHVVRAGGRLSLREEAGRCSLLRGTQECSVYADRPEQCRTFPFWPEVLEGGEGFAAARETCPGIFEAPTPSERARAYAALREFYARADAAIAALQPRCELSGNCCDFPVAGHRLFATWLEVDFVAERGPDPPSNPDAPRGAVPGAAAETRHPDWCSYYVGRRCTARDARPLACRAYYCDATKSESLAELHERLLRELRALEREIGYPEGYGDFVELLPARRAALAWLDASRRGETEASSSASAPPRRSSE